MTGHVSFDVDGLVLNGGNATGTPDGVDQVEGSLICDAGKAGPFGPMPLGNRPRDWSRFIPAYE